MAREEREELQPKKRKTVWKGEAVLLRGSSSCGLSRLQEEGTRSLARVSKTLTTSVYISERLIFPAGRKIGWSHLSHSNCFSGGGYLDKRAGLLWKQRPDGDLAEVALFR